MPDDSLRRTRARLGRGWRSLRRSVLARRRLLAAALTAVAVAAGMRVVEPPPPHTVPVPVARHDLTAGAVLDADDVRIAAYSPGTAPGGLVPDWVGRTLASPLRQGEPLTDVRLAGPSLVDGRPGLVAVPVRLPDAGTVALLAAGDRIDLVAADPRAGAARTVLVDAPVLAVPARADTDPVPGRLVVLGVPAEMVPGLAGAGVGGVLSFAFTG